MVEKVVDNGDETVMVEAFSDLSRDHDFGDQTVGAAIEAFEKIASGLFSLPVSTAAKDEEDNNATKFSPPGKLLRLPAMIGLGIAVAIDQNKATHQSIGSLSDKSALVEGNIVALYQVTHPGNSFVRMNGNSVNCKGGPKAIDTLPFDWDSERFLVVNAGNGRFALYSPSHRRFLASQNGVAEASVYPIGKLHEYPRCNESFRVEDAQAYIQLYCDIDNSSAIQAGNSYHFQVVQIHGFEIHGFESFT